MNILISNDDGVEGEGLKVLAGELSKKHKVYVLAPDRNQSAVSNRFSLFAGPLKIKKIEDNFYSCSGTPVDCVITGLTSGLFRDDNDSPVTFDAVLSGINRGENVGRDIVYSGTCAAARQAAFSGLPGIAVSLFVEEEKSESVKAESYKPLADFVCKNLSELMRLCEPGRRPAFVNVNGDFRTSYKGWKFTDRLCVKDYLDRVSLKRISDCDFETVFEDAHAKPFAEENSDYQICKDGYIAVSRVTGDCIAKSFPDPINLAL